MRGRKWDNVYSKRSEGGRWGANEKSSCGSFVPGMCRALLVCQSLKGVRCFEATTTPAHPNIFAGLRGILRSPGSHLTALPSRTYDNTTHFTYKAGREPHPLLIWDTANPQVQRESEQNQPGYTSDGKFLLSARLTWKVKFAFFITHHLTFLTYKYGSSLRACPGNYLMEPWICAAPGRMLEYYRKQQYLLTRSVALPL